MSRFVRRDSGRPITAAGSGGNDSDSGSASGVVMDAADAAAETSSSSDLRLDCESLPLRGATPGQVTTVLNHGTLPYVAIVEITHGSDTQEQEKEQVSTHAHQGGGGIGGEVVLVGVIGRADLHTLAAQQQHAPLPRQQQAAASTGDGPSSFNDVEVGDQCAEEEQDGGDAAAIAGGDAEGRAGEGRPLLSLGLDGMSRRRAGRQARGWETTAAAAAATAILIGGDNEDDDGGGGGGGGGTIAAERLQQLMQRSALHSVASHTSVGQLQLYFSRLGIELAYVVSAGVLEGVVTSQQVALQPPD